MATPLRIAFVTGTTPDKWARRWREFDLGPLELLPIEEPVQRAVLDDGSADMVLARLPLTDPDDLHVVRLYEEVPVVVVGREHPAAAYAELPLDDLVDEQFPLGAPSALEPAQVQLRFPEMSIKEAIEVVAGGTGVVVVPLSVARLYHRKDVVSVPLLGLEPTQVVLAWLRERDDDLTQAFVGVTRGRTPRTSR